MLEINEFKKVFNEYIRNIDAQLMYYLRPQNRKYEIAVEAMRYSIEAGGKRIRPMLVLEFCKMFGGDVKSAMPLACAIEMIHSSSLIHDDLPCMDDDDLRRGKPSCHIAFDEATALLAGDALMIMAFNVISSACFDNKCGLTAYQAAKACEILSRFSGVDGMIGGQVIDLASENQIIDPQTLKQMHEGKTAGLIKAACLMGAICGTDDKCTEENLRKVEQYGSYLGNAFQITDDILDVTADEKQLGKPVGSDAANKKTTYVTLFGLSKAGEIAQDYTNKAIKIIDNFENNDYIKQLTFMLLNRKY